MALISRTQALGLMQPYVTEFSAIVKSSWGDWISNPLAKNHVRKATRAQVISDQMMRHASEKFKGRTGVNAGRLGNHDGVFISGELDAFIRLKFADRNLRSKNYKTVSALSYYQHDAGFFGGVAKLELLYTLNSTETDIDRIVLTQRSGNDIKWSIDLQDASAQEQVVFNFAPMHKPDECKPTPAADRIIKPKKSRESAPIRHEQGTKE